MEPDTILYLQVKLSEWSLIVGHPAGVAELSCGVGGDTHIGIGSRTFRIKILLWKRPYLLLILNQVLLHPHALNLSIRETITICICASFVSSSKVRVVQ